MNIPISDDPFVRLDFWSNERSEQHLLLTRFVEIITTEDCAKVAECLEKAEHAQQSGNTVAGFVSYEAAAGLDPALTTLPSSKSIPLVWFGVCKKPVSLYNSTGLKRSRPRPYGSTQPGNRTSTHYEISKWMPQMDQQHYMAAFSDIRKHLIDGDTYQLNLTFPLQARFSGDITRLYEDLRSAQHARYSAWIYTGELNVLSLSPELFFHIQGDVITTRPMKGTRKRGNTTVEDRSICKELASNPKERAENVMIVDLLRNDLGRIATTGSVRVTSLFDTEVYPTVIQMTSTVQATLKKETRLPNIFKALFPSGSVVGAPKVKTMELITQHERTPRGVYCGAIGYLNPDGETVFNVPIRTLTIHPDGTLRYSVGSGVVADSDPEKEYNECLLKSTLFNRARWPEFQLLETMLFEPVSGFYLLDRHFARMEASAIYFGFPCNMDNIRNQLFELSRSWDGIMKVRVLLSNNGEIEVQHNPITSVPANTVSRVRLAKTPVQTDNPFLYHKTTNRKLYDDQLTGIDDVDDIILFNENGEVTESTIANIAVKINNRWVTPPVSCGLLAGTKRAELLENGGLVERVLTKKDVTNAEQVKLFNSVRGEYAITIIE